MLIKIRKFWLTCFSGIKRLPALVIFLGLLSFCHTPNISKYQDGIYDLDNPDYRYVMPKSLEEISGISWFSQGKLACIQDEDGMIFIYNLEKEKVTSTIEFGKDGDYEDISVLENTAYVLKSNGRIFRVKDFNKEEQKVKIYKTELDKKNETEGVTHDPSMHRLLIACKGTPSIDKERPYEGFRAVYSFDLESKTLSAEPVYLVDLRKIDRYKDPDTFTKFSTKLAKKLGLMDPYASFRPSGIAIHPEMGEIYILSSVGKLLIVMNREGLILGIKGLDANLFRQPEGICFSPGGDLYISNEGRGGKGYILKFKPKPDE